MNGDLVGAGEIEVRKQSEIDFHNRREVDRRAMPQDDFEQKYSNKKWYSIVRRSRDFTARWLETNCSGKMALDYCCGLGGMSLQLAQAGAFVHGIDISDESVKTARELLAHEGLGRRSAFQVMDAEKLTFPDRMFDVIVCSGVLHHLDLDFAYPQLARVLKPDGKILCLEALGHNPLINLYRRRTPQLRTSWETEHILKQKDLDRARIFFDKVEARYFHLCSIAAVPFRKSILFRPLLAGLEAIDTLLLSLPGVRLMAWQVVFELSRPKVRERLTKAA